MPQATRSKVVTDMKLKERELSFDTHFVYEGFISLV